MEFEFDPAKSEANQAKHGMNFKEAIRLWEDEKRIEIPARTTDEPRFMVIARIADKHWSGIIAYRGETIRIVSARRSRLEEITLYEG